MKTERNSSYELLRLISIFGIVVMHSFARVDTGTSMPNTAVHVFYNALFNTGVTCFILISGFFGIRFSLKKLIRIDMMFIFFQLFGTMLCGDTSMKNIIKACFPVLTRQQWFITCYFALCILAPFLNQIPIYMQKQHFQILLLVLLGIFCVVPTVTTYDIMQDAGKGLGHFIVIYLLGQYLARYKRERYSRRKLLGSFFLCILCIFGLDLALTCHNGVLYSTFARDCSIFIVLAAVILLLFFNGLHFKNLFMNRLASNVLAVTILEPFAQRLIGRWFELNNCRDSVLLGIIILGHALFIMLVSMTLNEVRCFLFKHIETWTVDFISGFFSRMPACWQEYYKN